MKTTLQLAIALFSLLLAGITTANADTSAGDADRGKDKSATCAACHGADGNSINPVWPSLAGQHASYTEAQLAAFKSGERQDVLMTSQAMLLDEQAMKDLAAYYASQSPTPKAVANKALINRGEQLYRGGDAESKASACLACHGPGGKGNPAAGYPNISGQHAAYVAKQLRDYASGARKSDREQMMRNVSAALSADDIEAIASYIQGLH